MAAAAATLADRAYFTADNPRGEELSAIFADMKPGVPASADVLWIDDRREAIARAIADAGPGDVVCVAGKGHEATQEVHGVFTPFSDRAVVEEILGGSA
jgi:UDP-N-acetylmuramoyl-L-alanyl-D-glutamate--2,6-diaminopimelate ligase